MEQQWQHLISQSWFPKNLISSLLMTCQVFTTPGLRTFARKRPTARWKIKTRASSTQIRTQFGTSNWALQILATLITWKLWVNYLSRRKSLTKSCAKCRQTAHPTAQSPAQRWKSLRCSARQRLSWRQATNTKRTILHPAATPTFNSKAWMEKKSSWKRWTSMDARDACCVARIKVMRYLISIWQASGPRSK